MVDHLLPPTYTDFEKALSETLGRVTDIDVPIDLLWDPQRCPAPHLPWLAWAMSVDTWDSDWPEQVKRDVIAASPEIHRFKGTRGAVERALAAIGIIAQITEWFDKVPTGQPGTFSVVGLANEHILGGNVILSAELQKQALAAVRAAKPLSRSFDFSLGAQFESKAGMVAVISRLLVARRTMRAGLDTRMQSTLGLAGVMSGVQVARKCISAGPGTQFGKTFGMAGVGSFIQVLRVQMSAAI